MTYDFKSESVASSRKIFPKFGRFRRLALDFLFPPTCLACGAETSSAGQLCAECFVNIHPVGAFFCTKCAAPFASAAFLNEEQLCSSCQEHETIWHQARAAYLYEGVARDLVFALKYHDRHEIARFFAQAMLRAGRDLIEEAEIIAPVPLHWRRLWCRKFNQAALLAKLLAKASPNAIYRPDLIERLHPTPFLSQLSVSQRNAAIASAFALRPGASKQLNGKRVVIVDDILTTGATAGMCASVLLKAGVAAVDIIVATRSEHLYLPSAYKEEI